MSNEDKTMPERVNLRRNHDGKLCIWPWEDAEKYTEYLRADTCIPKDEHEDMSVLDVVNWADGIVAALGAEDLSDRVTEAEAEMAGAILNIAHKRNYSF